MIGAGLKGHEARFPGMARRLQQIARMLNFQRIDIHRAVNRGWNNPGHSHLYVDEVKEISEPAFLGTEQVLGPIPFYSSLGIGRFFNPRLSFSAADPGQMGAGIIISKIYDKIVCFIQLGDFRGLFPLLDRLDLSSGKKGKPVYKG